MTSFDEPEAEADVGTAPTRAVRGARTVATDLASVSGARLLSAGLSVITVALTTRIVDPTQYSVIAFVNVAAGLMFTTTSAWTAAAVARYGREELEERERMTITSWNRLLITLPMVVLSAMVIVALRLGGGLPPEMTWTFTGLAITSGMLLILSDHTITLLEAAGRMRLTAGLLTLRQVASTLVLAAILVSGSGQTPVVIVALSTVALGLVTTLMINRVWHIGYWPPAVDRAAMHRMLAFSLPLIAFSASQYIIGSADLVVLRAHGSRADAGVYAIAYQGYTVLQQIPTTISIVLTPLFVSLQTADRADLIHRYVARVTSQLTLCGAVLSGLIVPFSGIAIRIVFGGGFQRAAGPFAVLLIALVLYARTSLLGPVLVLAERSRTIAIVSVGGAAVNVVLDILLVDVAGLGIYGPAIATAIALGTIAGGYAIAAGRQTGKAPAPVVFDLLPQLAATVVVVVVPGPVAIAAGIAATLILAALIVRWRVPFTAEDADLVAKLDLPESVKRVLQRALPEREHDHIRA